MKPNPRLRQPSESNVNYIVRRATEVREGDGHKVIVVVTEEMSSDAIEVILDYGDAPRGQVNQIGGDGLSVSLGKKPKSDRPILPHELQKLAGDIVMELARRRVTSATMCSMIGQEEILAFGAQIALLRGGEHKSKIGDYDGPQIGILVESQEDKPAVEAAVQNALDMNVGRLLTGMPTNLLGTNTLAEVIRVGAERAGLTLFEPTEEQYARMGLLNAVGQASHEKPRVLAIRIDPTSGPTKNKRVFVGKGLVFDNGGNNLKTNGGRGMRADKGGACALVAATLMTAHQREALQTSVVFVFGIVENCIGPGAYRPDDVLTAYDGKTVMIHNTDAEGRLVLYDCVAWISEELKLGEGDLVVTIATLTGGAVIALGKSYTALYLKDSPHRLEEVRQLEAQGLACGDPVNVLHIGGEAEILASKVADLTNASEDKSGHAQQGAYFATKAVPEAADFLHLDIAGSSGDFSGGNGCQPGTALPGGMGFLMTLILPEDD